MSARLSSNLRSSGQNVLMASTPREERATSTPLTHREHGTARTNFQDMTVPDMEKALAAKRTKRIAEHVRGGGAPQTARGLLEENRQLINEKQERKALARKNSREFVERIIAQDQKTTENDKAKEISRRCAQRELAQYYKAKIDEKERDKANEYSAKVESGVGIQYFPFVEGENINKSREAKTAKLRDEMRGFLQKQKEEHPPRMDTLLAETSVDTSIHYPVVPVAGSDRQARSLSAMPSGEELGDDVAPHMSRHPRFLSRAREHMSRRLHDVHVRKALEDKVEQTRAELEAQSRARQQEARQWEEGMLVNDALRYDSCRARATERRRHADYLRSQISERRSRQDQDHQDRHAEVPGYYGPEEKEVQATELHSAHCSDLIKQMEVDQQRRASSRNRRLRQERRLIDNCMAEMAMDRDKERQKSMQHREVLTTTWKSQQKIKKAIKTLEDA